MFDLATSASTKSVAITDTELKPMAAGAKMGSIKPMRIKDTA
jgi:hypothetical protein